MREKSETPNAVVERHRNYTLAPVRCPSSFAGPLRRPSRQRLHSRRSDHPHDVLIVRESTYYLAVSLLDGPMYVGHESLDPEKTEEIEHQW